MKLVAVQDLFLREPFRKGQRFEMSAEEGQVLIEAGLARAVVEADVPAKGKYRRADMTAEG